MAIKKNQHYVWRHYLKPWSSSNGRIYCARPEGLIYTSLKNVAVERFFYETIILDDVEKWFVVNLIKQFDPSFNGPLSDIYQFYQWSGKSEKTRKTAIEEFHTNIEQHGIEFLNHLYKESYLFLDHEDQKRHFCNYIAAQYTRTRKIRENLYLGGILYYGLDMKRLANIMHLIFIVVIGNWIFSKAKVEILKASGGLNFITSDQPIINAKGTSNLKEEPKEMELFYPISPNLAIYLSENREGVRHLTKQEVKLFNNLIVTYHNQQLFASQEGHINHFSI
jgi:hypothetical protein